MRIVLIALLAAAAASSPGAAQDRAGNTLITAAPVGPPPVPRHAWTPITAAGDVLATLRASGRFTVLIRAIGRAGLKRDVNKPNITLLAPSDTAFAAMPAGRLEALMKDRKALRRTLALHLIPARIDAAAARAATAPVATAQGEAIAFDVYRERLGVGDAVIIQADVAAGDGLIHVIDKVQEAAPIPAA